MVLPLVRPDTAVYVLLLCSATLGPLIGQIGQLHLLSCETFYQ